MPKKVDHHERRVVIAAALKRVARDQGFDEISLRHVAAEAEVSLGTVQHYFRTRDELMAFALTEIRHSTAARISAAVAGLGATPDPRGLLEATIMQMLALDEPRRSDVQVALALLSHTAVRPEVAATLHDETRAMLDFVADMIRTAHPTGRADPRLDPALTATGLLAMADGLNNYLLVGHYAPDRAVAALRAHLDLIFPG